MALQTNRHGFTKLIFLGIVAIILAIAAIKNPSVTESKQLIKDVAITKINEKLRTDIFDENKSDSQQFGSMLGMLLAPTFIDKFATITVNDYILFSTFKATIELKDEQNNLASGIILFGNVIPISSDIFNKSNQSNNSDS